LPRYDDDDVFDSSTAPEYDDNVFGAHCAQATRRDAVAGDVDPVAVCLAPDNDGYMVQDNTSFSKPVGRLCWVDPLLANQHKKVRDGLIGGTELSHTVRLLHCSLLSPNQAEVVESFELESAPPPPVIYDCYVELGSYSIIPSLFCAEQAKEDEVSVDTPTKCSTMGFHDITTPPFRPSSPPCCGCTRDPPARCSRCPCGVSSGSPRRTSDSTRASRWPAHGAGSSPASTGSRSTRTPPTLRTGHRASAMCVRPTSPVWSSSPSMLQCPCAQLPTRRSPPTSTQLHLRFPVYCSW
jgi:hypothetical protein